MFRATLTGSGPVFGAWCRACGAEAPVRTHSAELVGPGPGVWTFHTTLCEACAVKMRTDLGVDA